MVTIFDEPLDGPALGAYCHRPKRWEAEAVRIPLERRLAVEGAPYAVAEACRRQLAAIFEPAGGGVHALRGLAASLRIEADQLDEAGDHVDQLTADLAAQPWPARLWPKLKVAA
jgi:hypothetical protein